MNAKAQKFLDKVLEIWDYRFIRIGAYIFAGMMLAGLMMDKVVMPYYTKHGEAIQLPDVTRIRYEDAKDALEGKGFRINKIEERFDGKYPTGYVIEQIPRANTQVKSGRRVQVIVSKGERRVMMPNLVGFTERDSRLTLNRLNLVAAEPDYEYSSTRPEGVVTYQSIKAGIEIPMNTRIHISVSLGPIPDTFTVPLVEGRTLDDAKSLLIKAGLRVGTIRYEVMSALLPETVIRQSIKANTQVDKGRAINLVVSKL